MPSRRKPARRKQLGLSVEDYDAMLAAQGGGCAIRGCTVRAVTRRYNVDHDHETGEIRGLLCHVHNRRLWKGATADELLALAQYLEGGILRFRVELPE
jgi:hypothetical protein